MKKLCIATSTLSLMLLLNNAQAYSINWQETFLNNGQPSAVSYNPVASASASVDYSFDSTSLTLNTYSEIVNGSWANANANFDGIFTVDFEGAIGTTEFANITVTLSGDYGAPVGTLPFYGGTSLPEFSLDGTSYALNIDQGGTSTTDILFEFELGQSYDMYAYLYSVSGWYGPTESQNATMDIAFNFPVSSALPPTETVPEPSTLFLLGAGMLLLRGRPLVKFNKKQS